MILSFHNPGREGLKSAVVAGENAGKQCFLIFPHCFKKNTVEKKENADKQYFLISPQCFPYILVSFLEVAKLGIMW